MSFLRRIQERHAAQRVEQRRQFKDPDEGLQGRRTERRRRLKIEGEGEAFVIAFDNKFKPSEEMLELQKEIGKLRLKVIKAYSKLVASSKLNITAMRRLQLLISDISYLQTRYEDAEYRARQAFKADFEANGRKLEAVAEKVVPTFRVKLRRTWDASNENNSMLRAESDARKAEIREQRRRRSEMWRQNRIERTAAIIREEAEEAFAEDKIHSVIFRGVAKTLKEVRVASNPFEVVAMAFADDFLNRDQFLALKRACM